MQKAKVESKTQYARGQGQGHKKIRSQGQPFRGQTLSRPRTRMLKAKDQGQNPEVISKKKLFAAKFCKFSDTILAKKNWS